MRLVNKQDGKNILRSGAQANSLQIFTDTPSTFDSCNLGWPYDNTKSELLKADSVRLSENSPVRAVIEVKKRWGNSSFVQQLCIYPGVPRLDVHMHADWHEQHKVLKVAFPLDVAPEFAAYEVPYAVIQRPATYAMAKKPETPENRAAGAKYEVPALQWGDLSEGGRGFSLLNACKHGYDTLEPGTIRLTLLRGPGSPVPAKDPGRIFADQGPHDFTYALYPHTGDWKQAATQRRGTELKYRLLPLAVDAHSGTLPASHSFVSVEASNVILTAMKRAEDDAGVIFRFYEFEGTHADVRLRLPSAATRAVEVNLLEHEQGPVELAEGGREIRMSMGHHEIKSVKVSFSNTAGTVHVRRV